MPKAAGLTVSQSSLLDLRSITAQHADKFSKEGRAPVRGQNRRNLPLDKAKDPFSRPSPGLIKRMAAEARNDAKRRHFVDDEGGPSDEQRREIMLAKARKYDALRRGDLSGLSEKEIAESSIDFERKWQEDGYQYSDHSSDVDESAQAPRRWDDDDVRDEEADDLEQIEYVDELGRTRRGTRKEAKEAERAKGNQGSGGHGGIVGGREVENGGEGGSAYAEVLKSNVIHGEQSFFPVYEPDPEVIKAKYRAAEEEARAHHYDSTKEVRTKGAGQYQFSLDESTRQTQMESLKQFRLETENAQAATASRNGLTQAQSDKKRKLEERRRMIEEKRVKLLGGKERVEELREAKRVEAAEKFLKGLEVEIGLGMGIVPGDESGDVKLEQGLEARTGGEGSGNIGGDAEHRELDEEEIKKESG